MPTVPSKDLEAVQFFETHIATWTANALAIGTSVAAVGALDTKTKAARADANAQQVAKVAARTATNVFHDSVRAMRAAGADIIRQIRTQAEVTGNPGIYNLAQIPPPAAPTPLPPPGQPNSFAVSLTGSGAIVLAWKSTNSAPSTGAYFTVKRRLPGETTFTVVGGTGSKSFADDTVPAGVNLVTYIVQGFRGTDPGVESDQMNVQFGAAGEGVTASLKMAA